MLYSIARFVQKVLWVLQLGMPEQPGRNRAAEHASYVRRYSKINELIEQAARKYIALAQNDSASVHNEEYSILMQRSIAHKVKANEVQEALAKLHNEAKKAVGSHKVEFINRRKNLYHEFATATIGLELVYNALSSMVQRYEGK